MSGASFAQGYISFNATTIPIFATNSAVSPMFGGSGSGGVSDVTFAGTGANVSAYLYALLISPWTGSVSTDKNVWDGTWTAVPGITSSNSVVGGRVNAVTPAGTSAILVTGIAGPGLWTSWNAGVTNNIVLVGWSANLASTWSEVSNLLLEVAADPFHWPGGGGYFGETDIGYLTPNAASPGAALFGATATANGLPIDNSSANPAMLYGLPIPEPGTLSLAGLGGLSLLLFRRRDV